MCPRPRSLRVRDVAISGVRSPQEIALRRAASDVLRGPWAPCQRKGLATNQLGMRGVFPPSARGLRCAELERGRAAAWARTSELALRDARAVALVDGLAGGGSAGSSELPRLLCIADYQQVRSPHDDVALVQRRVGFRARQQDTDHCGCRTLSRLAPLVGVCRR